MKQVIVVKFDGVAYGIDVSMVREVVYDYTERFLPDSPNFVEGLAYVREQVLPIVKTKRLLESPYFDLHPNKKILVLSFGGNKVKSNVEYYDTSAVGIMVDDVVGIETYTADEVSPVNSVYNTKIGEEITGFINRKGMEIALLSIANFFVDSEGNFKYQKYIHSGVDNQNYKITKDDVQVVEKHLQGIFPFTMLTKRPILHYLARLSLFEETTIGSFLKKNPGFFANNIHTRKSELNQKLFENSADFYMLTEYIQSQIKEGKKHFNVFVIDNLEQSTISESLLLALESIRKGKLEYTVNHLILESQDEVPKEKEYDYSQLSLITPDMIQKYFVRLEGEEEKFSLHPLYRKNLKEYLINDWNTNNFAKKADLIYSPNFLVSQIENLDRILNIYAEILKEGGVLVLGLFEDIEDFVKSFKKYYIRNRLVFIRG